MDKSGKRISRRDFMCVVSGALVAGELGVQGCTDDSSSPSEETHSDSRFGSPVQDSSQSAYKQDTGLSTNTGGIGSAGFSGSRSGADLSIAGSGGHNDSGFAPAGSSGSEPVISGGNSASAGQPSAEAGQGGGGGSSPSKDAGPIDDGKSRICIVKTSDRLSGTAQAIAMVGGVGFAAGRDVVLKPNYNSANPIPASTDHDSIRQIVAELKNVGAGNIVLGESSGSTIGGFGNPTDTVVGQKGALELCNELGIDFVNYDNAEYENFQFPGMTWAGGLDIPKLMRSDRVKILMPCCKTHILADFTFSLKLAVGLVPRARRQIELHSDLANKIGEINMGFRPDLVVLDAMRCFIDNGPNTGTIRDPGLILSGTDRVAMDAVAFAILKSAGSNTPAIRGSIYGHPQIARAVQLGLGAASPDEIELVGDDGATISELRSILDAG